MKIKLLDLCCKAGGCSVGYYLGAQDLGYDIEIIGVDIEPQPNYPFTFIQADAAEYVKKFGKNFTHIHASPPCQKYSNSTITQRNSGKVYKDNLDELRVLMKATGKPGIIENVPTAPVKPDIVLRGDMFGLKVLRKRHFELVNCFFLGPQLPAKVGSVVNGDYVIVYGKCGIKKSGRKGVKAATPKFRKRTIKETWQYAMGIDWMKRDEELAEAIPPAYTRYISKEFFKS